MINTKREMYTQDERGHVVPFTREEWWPTIEEDPKSDSVMLIEHEVTLAPGEKLLLGNYRFRTIAEVSVGFTDNVPLVPVVMFAGVDQFNRWKDHSGPGVRGSGSIGVGRIADGPRGVYGVAIALHNPTDTEVSTTALVHIARLVYEVPEELPGVGYTTVGTLKKLADVASLERAFTRPNGEQLKLGKGPLVAEEDENGVVTISEEATGRPVMYMPVDVYEQMGEPVPVVVVKVEEKP